MARPPAERRIGLPPAATVFRPQDAGPPPEPGEVVLGLDEFEALRLADHERLYQEAGALRMGISRQTFARILDEAHHKLALVLVEGRVLRIEGGPARHYEEEESSMLKLAVPSRDGIVDAHFGHCAYFSLFTVNEGIIIEEGRLDAPEACGCKSGIAGELARLGVKKLLAGNIGEGAVRVLGSYGIEVLRGASGQAKTAVEDFISGKPFATGAGCAEHHEGCEHGAE